jgi:hypothetical protein
VGQLKYTTPVCFRTGKINWPLVWETSWKVDATPFGKKKAAVDHTTTLKKVR